PTRRSWNDIRAPVPPARPPRNCWTWRSRWPTTICTTPPSISSIGWKSWNDRGTAMSKDVDMVTDGPLPPIDERVSGDLEALDLFAQELSQLRTSGGDRSRSSTHEQIRGTEIMPSRIDAD